MLAWWAYFTHPARFTTTLTSLPFTGYNPFYRQTQADSTHKACNLALVALQSL
ncbi:TPA: hypothetical protein PXN31_004729 [Yersinia enterocolitica]|uniref:hypothetical protein n=1 Tax=Gammaproteobacteria TaxID=1236 RepID=UPI0015D231B4|nr:MULTISPECIES: hypothetical protein [Gammaproteobacteria]HDL7403913.1 hypothetical protein [Yersinia enterocolitica]EEG9006965.1 hypothetical protein [Escherichia coli]EEG9007414.1 hypothetical protein [Escherichia coli]EEG9052439.1 hypothetical protein [Escherichia coli]EEG9052796.1 hypothetical protein [Escherichia coli]